MNSLLTDAIPSVAVDTNYQDLTESIGIYDIYMVYSQNNVTPETYSIIYDANGGQGSITDSNLYELNEVATILSDEGFSREGYKFTGWNTSVDGTGTAVLVGSEFTVTANITLFAQWTEKISVDPSKPDTDGKTPAVNKPATNNKLTTSRTNVTKPAVKTGDQSNVFGYAVVALAAIVVIGTMIYRRKKIQVK